jgi:hypothetical protein
LGSTLERIRSFARLEQIARHFLCAEEASEVTSLDGAEQRGADRRFAAIQEIRDEEYHSVIGRFAE